MKNLNITEETLKALNLLKAERKFEESEFYPGAPDEATRKKCNNGINEMIEELVSELPNNPTKSLVLSLFTKHLQKFNGEDTEEREQAATYCENIMDILGIRSSDGDLNNWMYGFDPKE